MEVWRDGERRLKRRTDDAIEVYANRAPGDAEFSLSVLDLRRQIHTTIARTNLVRIGNLTDWFGLAHGLKHPVGAYRVAQGQVAPGAPVPAEPCRWLDLIQDERATHICWSEPWRVPMLIVAANGSVLWKITAIDNEPLPARIFEIHDEGFVRNDANQDIDND